MVTQNDIEVEYGILPIFLNSKAISNVTLYSALDTTISSNLKVKYIHIAWYDNDAKAIFLSSSVDKKTFTITPTKIMDIEGEVKDIKIIAKDDDFVITAIENIKENSHIRAATGVVTKEEKYDFKPCERLEMTDTLINVYTAWTKTETQDNSTDYFFFTPKCKPGEFFDINSRKCVPMVNDPNRGSPFGSGSGSHCTRLSILHKQNT